MKKYVLSLDKDQYRRQLFFAQENTQDFEIFSAINTMSSDFDLLSTQFNVQVFHTYYGRDITKGEIGCSLSHLAIYQQIIENLEIAEDAFCLICEDDALFCADFQASLEKILNSQLKSDILLVGQSKILEFKDCELEFNYPITFRYLLPKIEQCHFRIAYPYRNYFAGTVAYLIKKSAARKILTKVERVKLPYWLADDFILLEKDVELDIQVVRPLMVIENPKLNSNLEAVRGSVSQKRWMQYLKYPVKKLFAIKRNWGDGR